MDRSSQILSLQRGTAPLLLSLPHTGTQIPAELRASYVARALELEDTDWHLQALYDFAHDLGASVLRPRLSRYVVDLNRPPHDQALYAGVNNTALCPLQFFSGEPLYRPGAEPTAVEIGRRRDWYWQPYHDALRGELARLRQAHGLALLLDAHSIRSVLPWLFTGKLPDLNLGTVGGQSCAPALRTALARVLAEATGYTHVVDGRFQGGYITRAYGQPDAGLHAVQLELCWSCYMNEDPPYVVDECRAVHLRPVLRAVVGTLLAWAAAHG